MYFDFHNILIRFFCANYLEIYFPFAKRSVKDMDGRSFK